MTGVLEKGEVGTETQTGGTPCEEAGGDESDASTSQGMAVPAGGVRSWGEAGDSPSQESQPGCHRFDHRPPDLGDDAFPLFTP